LIYSNWTVVFAAFFVFGQYLLWGRLAYTAWRTGRTHYAVTTKRAMVLNAGSTRKITDMYFAKLDSVSLSVRADGIGTTDFSPGPRRTASWLRNPSWADIDLSMLTFYDIENARNVYQLIEDQRQQSLKWTPPPPHAVLSVVRHFDGPLETAGAHAMAQEDHWLPGFQAIRSRLFWQRLIRQTWETEND
jgi:hypothetical protein